MSNTPGSIRNKELSRSIKQVVKGRLCGNCEYRTNGRVINGKKDRGGTHSKTCLECFTVDGKPNYLRKKSVCNEPSEGVSYSFVY